jgi:uncharacterized membrane protein
VLQLPQLDAGSYTLTIKTLFSNAATLLKAPRYITAKLKLVVKGAANGEGGLGGVGGGKGGGLVQ